jgi:hypothetical protein
MPLIERPPPRQNCRPLARCRPTSPEDCAATLTAVSSVRHAKDVIPLRGRAGSPRSQGAICHCGPQLPCRCRSSAVPKTRAQHAIGPSRGSERRLPCKRHREKCAAAKNDGKLKRSVYEDRLAELHFELVKMQYWIKETGQKLVLVFEGRDAAGKGGAIKRITQRRPHSDFRTADHPGAARYGHRRGSRTSSPTWRYDLLTPGSSR